MLRLLVHVEGQTEESFVNRVLAPHLRQVGYSDVSARLLGNARQSSRRGGIRSWNTAKKEIARHLLSDPNSFSTTMVDYYALPKDTYGGWPGRAEAEKLPHEKKATHLHEKMLEDISKNMGHTFNPKRFIPYIMVYEFESLLFSDCNTFSSAIGKAELAPSFQRIRDEFETPEHINDSPLSAPSKRILDLVPSYQKPLMGVGAILDIGLNVIRRECPNFRAWLERLEALVQPKFT